jgi:murein DD-endopeptidase MepM/ murein hydrolase activator NlpD
MRQPLDNVRITQGYWNYNPQWYAYSGGYHTGIDYGANCGTHVKSVTSGTIIKVGFDSGFGNYVMVNHGEFLALYAHLSGFNCNTWQHLEEGQVLGFIGTTGFSTGCHLHFETKRLGSGLYNGWFNPVEIFNKGGNVNLLDKYGYQLGVTPKTFAHLSNPDEAKVVGVNLAAYNMRVLYGNNFIQIKGKPEVYQWITSPEALKIITDGKKINLREINIHEDEIEKYKESTKKDAETIAILTAKVKELEGREAVSPEDFTFLNSLKNWIKNLFIK